MRSTAVAALFLSTMTLSAQTPEKHTFEVASIKANPDPTPFGGTSFTPGGRFEGNNVTVRMLIQLAFGGGRPLPNERVVGAPSWIGFDHFNIIATTGPGVPQDEAGLTKLRPGYLCGLLEDRFQLKYHWEPRQLPAYSLALARRDGRLGPQLQHRTGDCSADPPCDVRFSGPGSLTLGGPMAYVAETLTRLAGRLVVDHTGLEGLFDVKLQWTPETLRDSNPTGASLADAVQDQLGLKLESSTGNVDVLVIDHVERPTED
jgi:uncharacterized protein (TIGR03435 family)